MILTQEEMETVKTALYGERRRMRSLASSKDAHEWTDRFEKSCEDIITKLENS
jgi:hypothetical protein